LKDFNSLRVIIQQLIGWGGWHIKFYPLVQGKTIQKQQHLKRLFTQSIKD